MEKYPNIITQSHDRTRSIKFNIKNFKNPKNLLDN